MKVKLIGFELSFSNGILLPDFYQSLLSFRDKERKIRSKKTIIYPNIVDGYLSGVVLTYKSNKKSLVSQRDNVGDLLVTKNELAKNEHGTEVSLFVINPFTLRGIFYSYTGAISAVGLSDLFRDAHNDVLRQKRKDYRNEITNFDLKDVPNVTEKVSAKFSGDFSMSLLATPSDLNDILSEYKKVKKVSLRAIDALRESGRYTPLESISKQALISIDVDTEQPVSEIKNILKSVLRPFSSWNKSASLRIYGESNSGEDLNLLVGDNNDNFGSVDYDEYVDMLPQIKWIDYYKSKAFVNIFSRIKYDDFIFGDDPKDQDWAYSSLHTIDSLQIDNNDFLSKVS